MTAPERTDRQRATDERSVAGRAARSVALCLAGGGAPLQRRSVLALCSGGIDSVVLVALLARLPRGQRPARLTVAWLDHGLRPAAEVEAERAAAQAVALAHGAGIASMVAADHAIASRGAGGLQAAARTWRYRAAAELALEHGADVVATGHTASDQLETVLTGLAADSGAGGIGGMPIARPLAVDVPGSAHLQLVRPLLAIDRPTVEAVAAELGLAWAEDPGNADTSRFRRNRIRHEVVPPLLETWPSAGAAIGRAAERIADERVVRDALAAALLDAWGDVPGESGSLDLRRLANLPRPARAEVVAAWLRHAGLGRALSTRLVDSIVDLSAVGDERSGRRGASIDVAGDACVRRDGYSLRIVTRPSARPGTTAHPPGDAT